ncbi:TmpG [Neorhizobium galegae bv. officinalis bv. officinalis str. HAMBI 1141]|uniref:TmpG n=1 Tax=Neorhizobium galegae bv. officinalis bv. officinalis str. HAMBI 1141 TaxID=1028801 RepID=A0A068T8A8_NEOGA|nr:DUF4815 domain-containing protein [Neorhizobium galegae]CDN54762.1 TmpG [Neorhizobium galegae bv. officinalis bv. officinalis str. HAMBI 1141]
MYEHESGLPFAYDRASGKPEQQGVVFYGERPLIQGAELNELQTIIRGRHDRLGQLVAREGNRIERADAIVDLEVGTVLLASGSIYVSGDVFPVGEAVLEDVPMSGRVEIGVRLVRSYLTHEDDPALLGISPGSLAEGEPGAARETASISWALEGDGGEGAFYSVYTLLDGTILDQTGPSILEPALQAIAAYDRPNGNYIVSGCRVTAISVTGGFQNFSIEQGEANINGYKRTRLAALRHAQSVAWEELAIPGETHTYTGGASFTFPVDQAPIGVINSILLTKEKTVTLTRGAIANGSDGLPDSSVISVSAVVQGGTTYVAATSYNLVANAIDWAPAGAEPAAGSTYNVTYRYRAAVAATANTDTTVTVSGGVAGGDIIISYTQKLPRIDRLCLGQDGSPIYIKGLPALRNPLPPGVPSDVLKLCQISNDWMSPPVVINDGVRSMTFEEQWRYNNRIIDFERLLQLERLKNNIDFREPVAKKGIFVDPFIDDSYRDAGEAQTGAIGNGMLQLAITPTFFTATLTAPVMLDWIEEVLVTQDLKTGCEKINPYQNFNPLPGTLRLTPAADFWTEDRTDWLSAQTIEFNRGTRTDGGPLQTVNSENQLVDHRVEQLEFLRQIPVAFTISGFGVGEILQTLTFDGTSVKPGGIQTANAQGQITGTSNIPVNVTAGTKIVTAKGVGGTDANAMFTGQGTIEIDTMRRVTTVQNWSAPQLVQWVQDRGNPGWENSTSDGVGGSSDPQAQMFAVPEMRQLVGVDFHICHVGNQANHLLVDQVSISNGYPTSNVAAEVVVPMAGAVVGWKSARYNLPLTTPADRAHAFVIKTDDADHSVSFAKLGGFDATLQKFVTSHPYVTGPRFSSVNARTWTAHQDEALAFRIVAARYPVTTKTVELGSFDLVETSDLQVRAAVELPGPGCSVVFEIERTNGTIYRLLPYQVLQLTEFITETVELRAILTGTEKLSPILFAPVQLVAGKIGTTLTYITRAFTLGAAVRLTSYFKAFLPGGASVAMHYRKDGGAWTSLPFVNAEALAFPLWTERKHEVAGQTGTLVQLRITGTGGPAARLIIGDLGAGIF